ncbi:hypothetical protein RND71_036697 [Anisodus tanguticus]|uniref:Uncharacterized protein n=1 Tax=Anisodus tanguticus TaxID=243964 RepID=A0AAE1R1Z2_9SOLA|nr:hypothetical protein RND71_036697 [Anisodus tanguticus]
MPDQGSDQEEYEDQKVEDDEDGMNEETFTHEEFLQGPTEGILFKSKESLFVFYKEHDTLKGFGIVKKTSNKKGADYIRLSRFMTSHMEVSISLKRHLVAHDIACLKPSKSIRLLEVQDGGPENMRCTPKDCRKYILQRRLRTLTTNGEAISRICDVAMDNEVQYRDFKNVMKASLAAYLYREDDMVVTNFVGVDESNEDDSTFIRNMREVLP